MSAVWKIHPASPVPYGKYILLAQGLRTVYFVQHVTAAPYVLYVTSRLKAYDRLNLRGMSL